MAGEEHIQIREIRGSQAEGYPQAPQRQASPTKEVNDVLFAINCDATEYKVICAFTPACATLELTFQIWRSNINNRLR